MHPSMHPPKCMTGLSEVRAFSTESLDQGGTPMPMRCLPHCPYRNLLGTLDHFLRAIWSDTQVPSHVRDSLQSRFRAFVQPAMESAAQELRQLAVRQAGRTIAGHRDGTLTSAAKSAIATTDPQVSGQFEFHSQSVPLHAGAHGQRSRWAHGIRCGRLQSTRTGSVLDETDSGRRWLRGEAPRAVPEGVGAGASSGQ
jgi:hypothetical protein